MVHKVAAHGDIILGLHLKREELERQAKALCTKLLEDWHSLDPDAIQVSEISGGITNILWKLQPGGDGKQEPVVLRIFGEQTDKIIDRDQEERVLGPLNRAGFGAQVLATFENGRIEEFLRMRPLKPHEMAAPIMAQRIAKRLAQFHSVQAIDVAAPDLFLTIKKWLQQARQLDSGDDANKASSHSAIDFDRLERCIHQVEGVTERLAPGHCFAHNDLLSGNILIPAEEKEGEGGADGEVQLIDFEYSGSSYCTYDIANHFCEYAGFECDYSRFPGDARIATFMRNYLQPDSPKSVGEEAVRKGVVECKLLALASHQFWGTWAILQAKFSPIEFDYMGYSKLRWDECFRREQEFLTQAQIYLEA